jgi:hypothetical protein
MPGSVKQSASLVRNGPQHCLTLEVPALRCKDKEFFCGFAESDQRSGHLQTVVLGCWLDRAE